MIRMEKSALDVVHKFQVLELPYMLVNADWILEALIVCLSIRFYCEKSVPIVLQVRIGKKERFFLLASLISIRAN